MVRFGSFELDEEAASSAAMALLCGYSPQPFRLLVLLSPDPAS